MIVQTINESLFVKSFWDYGRGENFSYEGLCTLFEYLEETFPGDDNPYILDVIALCCEFSEFNSLEALEQEFDMGLEAVQDNTTVLEVCHTGKNSSYIVGEF